LEEIPVNQISTEHGAENAGNKKHRNPCMYLGEWLSAKGTLLRRKYEKID
jgi:hypothetical protein